MSNTRDYGRAFTILLLKKLADLEKISFEDTKSLWKQLNKSRWKDKFKAKRLAPGEQILWQDRKNAFVYLIFGGKGSVVVSQDEIIDGQLRQLRKNVMDLPNIAGEMSLITAGTATAHVMIAKGEVIALEFKINDFHEVIKQLKLQKQLLNLIQQRFRGQSVFKADLGLLFPQKVLEDKKKREEAIKKMDIVRPDLAWRIIARGKKGVVVFNAQGLPSFIEITPSSSKRLLGKFLAEELADGQSRLELRQECLYRNPEIATARVYVKKTLPLRTLLSLSIKDKNLVKKELREPDNWFKGRLAFHKMLTEKWKEIIVASDRLLNVQGIKKKPLLILLSGNTGAGKSYVAEHISTIYPKLALPNISGVIPISPDAIKAEIRKQEGYNEEGNLKISADQSHFEGAWITEELISWGIENSLSMVIDKRFLIPEEVLEIATPAKAKEYYILMIDIDAELQTSLDRVFGNPGKNILGRDPNGVEAMPTREVIEDHYKIAVFYRYQKSCLKEINEYYLFKSDADEKNRITELAKREKVDAPLHILSHHRPLFYHATRDPKWDTLVDACIANIYKMSRTSKGELDLSSTKIKSASFSVSPERAAIFAKQNVRGVLDFLFKERNRVFKNAKEVREFIEQIASDINAGILKKGSPLYRNADSKKYAYTPFSKLDVAMESFCSELYGKLKNRKDDPVSLAAWIEYKIDLTDHFFQDGCGRIAKVLSAWVLVRAYGVDAAFPNYPGREEYYSPAAKGSFAKWLKYYRTL